MNGMVKGVELRVALLTGVNGKLVEVIQLLSVDEKPKEKEMEELLEIYDILVVLFLKRTHTQL